MNPKVHSYQVLLRMPEGGCSWVVVTAFTEAGACTMAELSCDGAQALCVIDPDLDCQGVQR